MTAGNMRVSPSVPLISIDGINNDQTDAATMTPEANPNNIFCTSAGICRFSRNTQAAPNAVPAKGNSRQGGGV